MRKNLMSQEKELPITTPSQHTSYQAPLGNSSILLVNLQANFNTLSLERKIRMPSNTEFIG